MYRKDAELIQSGIFTTILTRKWDGFAIIYEDLRTRKCVYLQMQVDTFADTFVECVCLQMQVDTFNKTHSLQVGTCKCVFLGMSFSVSLSFERTAKEVHRFWGSSCLQAILIICPACVSFLKTKHLSSQECYFMLTMHTPFDFEVPGVKYQEKVT